ncbi:MAG: hypothetical protein CL607_08725 [Anaerolineaceae bacterium]|nr:hypothetical protein [Anaerolineaceae bacterium]
MPYTLSWYVEDAVIIIKVTGSFPMTEICNAVEEVSLLIQQSDRESVHILADLTDISQTPKSVRLIASEVKKLYDNTRIGWTIAYGIKNSVVNIVASIVTQILSHQYITTSEEEAIAFLQNKDEDLRPLLKDYT